MLLAAPMLTLVLNLELSLTLTTQFEPRDSLGFHAGDLGGITRTQ